MKDIRWLVDFDSWNPSEEEWASALEKVGEEEASRIKKFNRGRGIVGRLNPDAKSSLLGRLMIRRMMSVAGLTGDLLRTKEGKPYLVNHQECPTLNFNISHAGRYVSFATTTSALIGVDVMEIQLVPKKELTEFNLSEFFDSMEDCFTTAEWSFIKAASTLDDQLANFYTLWTLKESYIKAVGIGLGLTLQRLEFTPSEWKDNKATATLLLDGKEPASRWNFFLNKFDKHIVAVAATPNFGESISSLRDILMSSGPGDQPDASSVACVPFEFIPPKDLLD